MEASQRPVGRIVGGKVSTAIVTLSAFLTFALTANAQVPTGFIVMFQPGTAGHLGAIRIGSRRDLGRHCCCGRHNQRSPLGGGRTIASSRSWAVAEWALCTTIHVSAANNAHTMAFISSSSARDDTENVRIWIFEMSVLAYIQRGWTQH